LLVYFDKIALVMCRRQYLSMM